KDARYPLALGSSDTRTTFNDSTGFAFVGDTITLKWAAIDRSVFNFYSTLEYSLGTVGNPFATPINAQSNISNGALGIWAAYSPTFTTIVVKE
ncbi:MAG: hypothetical protein ABI378_13525, partial [Chitinophagaceae bacterium]